MTRRDGAGEVAERVKPGVPFNGGDPRSGEEAVHWRAAA